MNQVAQLTEHSFRHEYGRLVAALTRNLGIRQLDEVEDAVQSALMKAMNAWARHGMPTDPAGWLYRTARNELVDRLRRANTWKNIQQALSQQSATTSEDTINWSEPLEDDQLRMLFVCCHPALGVEAQITFALKTLCGFNASEIAHAFLTSEATIHKRLTRAKETLREEALDPNDLTEIAIQERLASVQTILYLLFNEGYNSHHPDNFIRFDLCEEAVRLTQLLIQNPSTASPDTMALFALMLFHAGRLQARVNEAGGLVLLDEQNRDQWDWSLIKTGFTWLERASVGEVITKYHLEAAIAAEHCQALSFDQTNWKRIDELYELLYRMEPTAIHALNRSIALAYLHSPQAGITWFNKLHSKDAPPGYHHWPAVLGELHRRQGDLAKARGYFEQALAMSPPSAERAYLEMRREQCLQR
jgi:RNA polymerase sigma factor (sigma-70 family)